MCKNEKALYFLRIGDKILNIYNILDVSKIPLLANIKINLSRSESEIFSFPSMEERDKEYERISKELLISSGAPENIKTDSKTLEDIKSCFRNHDVEKIRSDHNLEESNIEHRCDTCGRKIYLSYKFDSASIKEEVEK